MCSSRNRNTYGITTSSFSPPTNEAIPLRLALLNPWLAPWIGYRTADGYFSTACSEYLDVAGGDGIRSFRRMSALKAASSDSALPEVESLWTLTR